MFPICFPKAEKVENLERVVTSIYAGKETDSNHRTWSRDEIRSLKAGLNSDVNRPYCKNCRNRVVYANMTRHVKTYHLKNAAISCPDCPNCSSVFLSGHKHASTTHSKHKPTVEDERHEIQRLKLELFEGAFLQSQICICCHELVLNQNLQPHVYGHLVQDWNRPFPYECRLAVGQGETCDTGFRMLGPLVIHLKNVHGVQDKNNLTGAYINLESLQPDYLVMRAQCFPTICYFPPYKSNN